MKKNYIDTYNQNGWLVIKSFLNNKEVNSAKKNIYSFLSKNINKYKGRSINFVKNDQKISEVNSFHELHDCKWVKDYSKKKKITNLVKKLLPCNKIELRASEYFAKPKKIGLKAPVHQDNFYWNVKDSKGLTIWIALSKSSKKNGTVYYYNGSHKHGLYNHKKSFAKGSSQTIKNLSQLKKYKKVFPTLNAGDILIHHCLIVHGSNSNKSNQSRVGWTFQYKDKNSKYDKKAIKKYESELNKQLNHRK